MRLRCPNCHCELDVVPLEAALEVKCPSCGSQVDISGSQETIVYIPRQLSELGPFVLVERIGRGHFGDVYKAKDSRLERIVALKVPRTAELSFLERETFFREARTAARLRHANIVTVHEVGTIGDTIFIASEFIDGVTLAERMDGKPLEPRAAAEICAKVAEALQHAHEQGVIHRDLKPRNIMLDAEGEPHLLDFGLAKRDAAEFTITTEGEILGTPAYMAPEQARGQAGAANARTDVYALGVTLYEMLTGARPFAGETRGLIYQILHDEPKSPRKLNRQVPQDLETICLKAMSKEPARRYATAGEMAADLKRYLAGEPIRARPAGLVERSWRWCRRNPAWCAAGGLETVAGVLVLAMIAGAVWSGTKRRVELDVRLAQGPFARNSDPQASTAEAVIWPLDAEGEPVVTAPIRIARQRPPLRTWLESGDYFVVVIGDDDRFHEVFRHVPQPGQKPKLAYSHTTWKEVSGRIQWAPVSLPLSDVTDGMAYFEGSADFVMGTSQSTDLAPHHRYVPAFYLDAEEVSVGLYNQSPGSIREGLSDANPSWSVGGMGYDDALAWAERRGKILPSETQFEFASTKGGTQPYPWGHDGSIIMDWPLDRMADFDRTLSRPTVRGLYSGRAEWTRTWMQFYPRFRNLGLVPPFDPREYKMVRGAPGSIIDGKPFAADVGLGARYRQPMARGATGVQIGFRCARSAKPHTEAEDFEQVLYDGE
jgi:formylglycine-generating enzyme required for sulfatase activity/predicted Ser/Thr protein kinase